MTRAEHILRDSGVPYTILRVGAVPEPAATEVRLGDGRSYLSTDLSKFGGVLRADLNEQVLGCLRARSACLNQVFVVDDPTLKPQVDHFLCKRAGDRHGEGHWPQCGDMPDFSDAHPPWPP